jgi:hypothetical protein
MVGVEGRLRQEAHQQFKAGLSGNGNGERRGRGEAGSARQYVTDLLQRQRLSLPDINEYCLMWSDLRIETGSGRVSEEVHQSVVNVSGGLDFLLFDKVGEAQRDSIISEHNLLRRKLGIDRYVLPYEDAKLLQLAAAAVNVPYNPGEPEDTQENIKKRTFLFADLEDIHPTTTVVDAGK